MNRPGWKGALLWGALGLTVCAMGPLPAAGASSPDSASAMRGSGPVRGTGMLPAKSLRLLHHRLPDALRPDGVAHVASAGPSRALPSATRATLQTSSNWSGEVQQAVNLSSVSATWTVPSVVPSSTPKFTATWVGIGGFSDQSLIQTGSVEATATGLVGYAAWVELLPTQSLTVTLTSTPGGTAAFQVAPGDVIEASVKSTGATQWDIVIEDATAGWTYNHTFAYSVAANSAEWITERPTVVTTTTHQTALLTLADYGSTRFSHLMTATGGGVAGAPGALTPIRMMTTGNVISAPGPLAPAASATGESFTDSYLTVPARIYGTSADDTAAVEFEHQFTYLKGACPSSPTSGRAVVLATDKTYPDALASAYLASYLGTGTLLTGPTSIPATTLTAIRQEGITHVYVVGGALAIDNAVVSQLEATPAYDCGGTTALAQTVQVTRIAGATQYDTARDIATEAGPTPGSVDLGGAYGVNGTGAYNVTTGKASASAAPGSLVTAILATGKGFQDAEAASTLSYASHLPIVLTTPSTLSTQALGALQALQVKQVIVMGGPLAVSNSVVGALEGHGMSVLRVAGADATQTAIELARCEVGSAASNAGFGWTGTGKLIVARGDFYSDGLAGAVVAADGPTGTAREPLLLTESPSTLGTFLPPFLESAGTTGFGGVKVTGLTILGGPGAVSQTSANTMVVALLG
jgi:putative cell wall-binding protein